MRITAAAMTMMVLLNACALAAFSAPALPVSAEDATAIRLGKDSRKPWRPYAITLKPAKWIWLPAERTLPNSFVLFRKEVELPAEVVRANGWISADSRYRLTVNGRRVQWGPASCDPRNLDADPIDLKPWLQAGRNVIGVEVLFYGHGEGTWPGGKPGLILNLDIEMPGGRQRIVTDQSSARSAKGTFTVSKSSCRKTVKQNCYCRRRFSRRFRRSLRTDREACGVIACPPAVANSKCG